MPGCVGEREVSLVRVGKGHWVGVVWGLEELGKGVRKRGLGVWRVWGKLTDVAMD